MKPTRVSKAVNVGRHEANCSVCAHSNREDIERDFVEWKSPVVIAKDYELTDRRVVYRHAHAFGLLAKRDRNIRAALARMIEKSGDVEITASAAVAAIQAYAKINAAGQWVERSETVNLNELFDRMTRDELEKYAREGDLPDWFKQAVTPRYGQEGHDGT